MALAASPEAEALCEEAVALARQGLRLGATEAAHAAAAELFEHFGGVELGVLLAEAQVHGGDLPAARALLASLIAQHGGAAAPRVLLAALELAAGDAEAAVATCEPIADSGPDGARICAQALLGAGHCAEAREFAMEAVDRHPPDADLFLLLGTACLALDRPDEAIESFSEAIRLAPGRADAYHNLAVAFARSGAVPAALGVIDAGLLRRPADELLLGLRAQLVKGA